MVSQSIPNHTARGGLRTDSSSMAHTARSSPTCMRFWNASRITWCGRGIELHLSQ